MSPSDLLQWTAFPMERVDLLMSFYPTKEDIKSRLSIVGSHFCPNLNCINVHCPLHREWKQGLNEISSWALICGSSETTFFAKIKTIAPFAMSGRPRDKKPLRTKLLFTTWRRFWGIKFGLSSLQWQWTHSAPFELSLDDESALLRICSTTMSICPEINTCQLAVICQTPCYIVSFHAFCCDLK